MVVRATIAQGRFIWSGIMRCLLHLGTAILVRRSATESALPSKAPAKSCRGAVSRVRKDNLTTLRHYSLSGGLLQNSAELVLARQSRTIFDYNSCTIAPNMRQKTKSLLYSNRSQRLREQSYLSISKLENRAVILHPLPTVFAPPRYSRSTWSRYAAFSGPNTPMSQGWSLWEV
jgi:hypothetical protein